MIQACYKWKFFKDEKSSFDSNPKANSISGSFLEHCFPCSHFWSLRQCPCFFQMAWAYMHLQNIINLQRCVFLFFFWLTLNAKTKGHRKVAFNFRQKEKVRASSTVTLRTKVLFFNFIIICPYQVGLWLFLGDKREHKERKNKEQAIVMSEIRARELLSVISPCEWNGKQKSI